MGTQCISVQVMLHGIEKQQGLADSQGENGQRAAKFGRQSRGNWTKSSKVWQTVKADFDRYCAPAQEQKHKKRIKTEREIGRQKPRKTYRSPNTLTSESVPPAPTA